MPARTCRPCGIAWNAEETRCPLCDGATTYNGSLVPDGANPAALKAMRQPGAYIVIHESVLVEVLAVSDEGVQTSNSRTGYVCDYTNADLIEARLILPELDPLDPEMAQLDEALAAAPSLPDPAPPDSGPSENAD